MSVNQEITIKTQEDLCGDDYLDNGELKITRDEHYKNHIVLEGRLFNRTCISLDDLKSAIIKLEAGESFEPNKNETTIDEAIRLIDTALKYEDFDDDGDWAIKASRFVNRHRKE